MNVPVAAGYITGTSVDVSVTASKAGYTSPSAVEHTLTVDLVAPTAPTYTAPGSLTVGAAITTMSPTEAIGVSEYDAPGLPAGLSIDAVTGVISGTPTTAATDTASVTVTVSDTAGNSATVSITFPAVAKGEQTLSGFSYSSSSVTFGSAAPTVTAPGGAQGALSYTASPSGVCTVDAATGALTLAGVGSCTVTVTAAATADYNATTDSYTVTVQTAGSLVLNVDAVTGDDIINIAEKAAGFAISGNTGTEGDVSVTVGVGGTNLTATSSTSDPATWSVNVPADASYIAGASVDVTVSAAKTGFIAPSAVERTLTVDLTAPVAPSYTAPGSLKVGAAITSMSPTGASDVNEYSASGLPAGLGINAGAGVISGTPTAAATDTASVTVTVSDSGGNTDTVSITFPAVAKGDQTLSGFSYSASSVTFGSAAPTLTAPSGVETTLSYAASPSDVCTVNAATGALTLAGVGSCAVTVTAADTANYNEARASHTVTVQTAGSLVLNVDTIASDDTVNIAEKAEGFVISGDTGTEAGVSVTVQVGTGTLSATSTDASGTATWSVNVPADASYITGTGVSVSVTAAKAGYTSPDAVQRALDIGLTAPVAPSYTAPGSLKVGAAITAMSPTGAIGVNEYSASGLPTGLSIDDGTGVISGTPTAAATATASVTVTVSDTAGNTDTVDITFPAVAKGDQTLSGFSYSSSSVTFGSAAPTLTAPGGAQGALSYAASPSNVCTVGATTGALTLAGLGSCTVTVTAAATADYEEGSDTATVTVTVQTAGTLLLNLDMIADDNTVNIAEKAAGFAISGDTGTEAGVAVTVQVGTATLSATSADDSGTATWSVDVPADTPEISGTSVDVRVTASKAGYTSPSAVQRTLTVDLDAPEVESIVRHSPAASPTDEDSLVWRVTFSEAIANLDAADFAVTGTVATITVASVGADVIDVTITGGDLTDLDGTVTLAFASAQNIIDRQDNALSNTTPTGTNDNNYVVDNTAPTMTIGDVPATSTAQILVSNSDASVRNTGSTSILAQSITTGDHRHGYTVSQIEINIRDFESSRTTVKLYSNSNNGQPQDLVATLVNPVTFTRGFNTFTAPSGTTLSRNTTYWIVLNEDISDVSSERVGYTTTTSKADTSSYGWSIGDKRLLKNLQTGSWGTNTFSVISLTVKGNFTSGSSPLTVTISGVPDTSTGPFMTTFTFPETVTGFTVDDITLTNATVSSFMTTTSPGVYTALITPTAAGAVTVDVAAGVATDEAGNGNSAAVQATSNYDPNAAPEFDDASLTRSIAENTAADVNVGAVIPAATDTDSGDTLTYTMEGTDAAEFNFDATTRQITTKAGVTYDFETKPNYSVTIKVSDETDTDTVAVTITLTDVNEIPSAPIMASSLVSNLGQTEAVSAPLSSFDTIQGFLTGAGGYTLTSVQLRLKRLTVGTSFNVPSVKLRQGTTSGTSATLTGQEVVLTAEDTDVTSTTGANYTFTAPASTTLSASTRYFIVVESAGRDVQWLTTDLPGEDATPATGWSIDNNGGRRPASNTGAFDTRNRTQLLSINGITTTSPNNAPIVATAIPDQTATVGRAFTYAFPDTTFTDADSGDTLSYTAIQSDDATLPTWLTFTASTRTFAGTPAAADAGAVTVKVTASDTNSGTVSDEFDIVVSVPNMLIIRRLGSEPTDVCAGIFEGPANDPVSGQICLGVFFTSEGMLAQEDVGIENGTIVTFSNRVGNTQRIKINIDTSGDGDFIFRIPQDVMEGGNTAVEFRAPRDMSPPTLTMSTDVTPPPPVTREFRVNLKFSERIRVDDEKVESATGAFTIKAGSFPTGSIVCTNCTPERLHGISTTPTLKEFGMDVLPRSNFEGMLVVALRTGAVISVDTPDVTIAAASFEIEVDTLAPRVASIVRQAPASSPTDADQLTWRVTFSEAVAYVDATDFDVSGTTATLEVSAVSGVTGAYDVTASGGDLASVTDTVTLTFVESHGIRDEPGRGNALRNITPTGANEVSYAVDNTAPTVASIVRQAPASSPTNADDLTWRVTFSEEVTNVDAADFAVSGTTATVTAVAAVTSVTGAYDVTASGSNLADLNGTVTLSFAAGQSIQDEANNALANTAPTGANDNDFELDNTAPTVTISGVSDTSAAAFTATITFTEPVTGFVEGDITLANATASAFTATDAMIYTALITPTADGAVTVDVAANAATDAAGNGNAAAAQVSSVFDSTAPTVMSIVRQTPASSPTNADSLTWRVMFSENVADVNAADFTVSGTTATLTVSEVTASTVFDVKADGGDLASLDSTAALSFASGQDIADTTGNELTNTAPTGTNNNDYVVDNTAPTVTIGGVPETSTAAFTATITFTEPVTGFDEGDITLANATASAFTATDAMIYTALITPTADGAVTVDVAANAATDAAGNGNAAAVQVSSVFDSTAPTVMSIVRQTPASSPTNTDELTWRVMFSENVANVNAADFTVSGTTAALTISEVTASTVFDVKADGGDLASLDATAALSFASGQDIVDTAGNELTNTTPSGTNDNNYVLDNTAPVAPTYTAPGSLKVGAAITEMSPTGAIGVNEYSASGLPTGLRIDAVTGVISGTPEAADTDTASVTVTVSDTASNTATVGITFPAVAKGDQTLSQWHFVKGLFF